MHQPIECLNFLNSTKLSIITEPQDMLFPLSWAHTILTCLSSYVLCMNYYHISLSAWLYCFSPDVSLGHCESPTLYKAINHNPLHGSYYPPYKNNLKLNFCIDLSFFFHYLKAFTTGPWNSKLNFKNGEIQEQESRKAS